MRQSNSTTECQVKSNADKRKVMFMEEKQTWLCASFGWDNFLPVSLHGAMFWMFGVMPFVFPSHG